MGPLGGLRPVEERVQEGPERLASLGAGAAADIEYEQFMQSKEIQRTMFKACQDTAMGGAGGREQK